MRLFGFGRQASSSEIDQPGVPAAAEDRSMTASEARDVGLGMNFALPSFGAQSRHERALGFSASWAAINILAQDVSKLPINIYRKRSDGGREIAKSHPVHRILRKPNNYQTRLEMIRQWVLSLLLDGNAYGLIERDRSYRPAAVFPVLPGRIQVLQDEASLDLFYRIGAGNTRLDQRPVVPSEDMIHIRWLSVDGVMGISPISAARMTIDTGLSLETHAKNLFKNGARPSGVLKTAKQLKPDVAKRLKESWQTAYNGAEGAGRTAILEDGLEWQSLTFNSVDAQFLEQRRFAVTEIARIFRIPPHMLADLDKATFNNVEQSQAAYYRDTLMPILELVESVLNAAFGLEEDELYVEFDVTRLLRADTKARYETHVQAREWGLKSANEIRQEEGLNPYPGGDLYLAPLNHGDATQVGRAPTQEPAPSSDDVRSAVRSIFKGAGK